MKFEDLIRKIAPNRNMILVGGNAVVFWSQYYQTGHSTESLTTDIDFFGTKSDLLETSEGLDLPHEDFFPDMGDPTPNSGKMVIHDDGNLGVVEVDFLRCVTGLGNSEISKRAVEVSVGGMTMRVLHPLHCLESKLANLLNHPSKRDAFGLEQARIAVDVVRKYLETLNGDERRFINESKNVFEISRSEAGIYSKVEFGIDSFSSIPDSFELFDSSLEKIEKFYELTFKSYKEILSDECKKYTKNKERIEEFKKRRKLK